MTSGGIHLKTRDRLAVVDALRTMLEGEGLRAVGGDLEDAPPEAVRALIAAPRGGWTSVYAEDERWQDLAPALSAAIGAPSISVRVVEEAAFAYRAYDAQGLLADEYHSCPDYERDVDQDDTPEEELERTRGDVEALSTALGGAKDAAALAKALAGARIERLRDASPWSAPVDNTAGLAALRRAFGLPDLTADFDVLWELGPDDDQGELHALCFAPPRGRRVDELLERVRQKLPARLRGAADKKSAVRGRRQRDEDGEDGGDAADDEDTEDLQVDARDTDAGASDEGPRGDGGRR